MSGIETNSQSISDAIKHCVAVCNIFYTSQKSLKDNLLEAENKWVDDKYKQLCEIVNDCNISLKRALSDSRKCLSSLCSIQQSIAEYESINFNRSSTSDGSSGSVVQMHFDGVIGGSYGACCSVSPNLSGKAERHHMPAKSIIGLHEDKGPAIIMDKADHILTASYGNKPCSKAYRKKQSELISQGNFKQAFQMDIDDLRLKFGDKYDLAIAVAIQHLDKLILEGIII